MQSCADIRVPKGVGVQRACFGCRPRACREWPKGGLATLGRMGCALQPDILRTHTGGCHHIETCVFTVVRALTSVSVG